VTGARGDGLAVIRRRARRVGVPLTEVDPAPIVGWDRDAIEVELPRLGRTRVGLRGRHQAANVAIADATLDALESAGIATVPDGARRVGYANAVWPGRLELLRVRDHDVLLDGAHNPAGAAALAVALDDLRPFLDDGPVTLVTASMADKDVDGVIAAFARADALDGATVIATSLDVPRAMSASELAARWRTGAVWGEPVSRPDRVVAEPDPLVALERALAEPGPVVVAGSLYLVGEVRGALVDDPALRDPDPPEDR
jgi:dihydrofolate synthase/folylpolyglutamate synthase